MTLGDLLNKLEKVKRLGNGEYEARCPAHEDRKPSLSIKAEGDRILVNCHTGCSVDAVCAALGITVADLFLTPKGQAPVKAHRPAPPSSQIVAEYSYTDEAGKELFQVVRLNPKSFRQRHRNGSNEWAWNLDGVRRVLYHLPEVVKAKSLFFVEGEKDVDNLRALGLTATTSPGGAQGWKAEYGLPLAGKTVTLIPDMDGPGLEYARDVARDLEGKAQLSVVLLPPPAKDISDWLEGGGDVKALPSMGQGIEVLFETEIEAHTEKEIQVTELIGGGYEFAFLGAEKLRIRVERIRAHSSDGRITGEVRICNGVGKSLYPPTSLNFSADRSRNSLAKSLLQVDNRPWEVIINRICEEVMTRAREGTPVQILSTFGEVIPPTWLLKPLLYEGLPTIIFGEKGVAKSTLAMAAYLTLVTGWIDNPMGWELVGEPIRTLYLDYEVGPEVAKWTLQRLVKGMGQGDVDLYYRRGVHPLADEAEQVQRQMEDHGCEALIIDSLSRALGGDTNETALASRFAETVRGIGKATLIIAQTSKPGREDNGKKRTVLGSTLHEYFARLIYELRRSDEEENTSMDVALYNPHHNLGARFRPQGYRLTYQPQGVQIETCAITAPELVARLGEQNQILRALKHGRRMPADLAVELGLTPGTVSVTLDRMKKKGQVIRFGDGWGLAERES